MTQIQTAGNGRQLTPGQEWEILLEVTTQQATQADTARQRRNRSAGENAALPRAAPTIARPTGCSDSTLTDPAISIIHSSEIPTPGRTGRHMRSPGKMPVSSEGTT